MRIELTADEVDLLLRGMGTLIEIAARARWPLEEVRPFIDLQDKIDRQTMSRHKARDMSKTRPYTDDERAEVHRLCVLGRLGRLPESKWDRVAELRAISPGEYAEIHQQARAEADRSVNPLK